MNYEESLEFLNSFQEIHHGFDLEKTRELVQLAGLEIDKLRVVHVAGTNGKGSASIFISSILMESGFKVGTYTSPHLLDVRERIRINGEKISEEKFSAILNEMKTIVGGMEKGPSYFELMTVSAMKYFIDDGVDFAVFEVGLGGRLDATNVLNSEICVFTDIAIDHTQMLGETVEKIAAEKAAIIKEGSVVVVGEGNHGLDLIRRRAKKLGCKIIVPKIETIESNERVQKFNLIAPEKIQDLKINLIGEFQQRNATVALGAALELGVGENAIRSGLRKAEWPGRLHVLKRKPFIVLDSAHNVAAVKEAMDSLKFFEFEKLILVTAILKDKDIEGMMKYFCKADGVIASKVELDRAADPEKIAEKCGKAKIVEPISKAFEEAEKIATEKDLILVSGSIYTVAEALKYYKVNVD